MQNFFFRPTKILMIGHSVRFCEVDQAKDFSTPSYLNQNSKIHRSFVLTKPTTKATKLILELS